MIEPNLESGIADELDDIEAISAFLAAFGDDDAHRKNMSRSLESRARSTRHVPKSYLPTLIRERKQAGPVARSLLPRVQQLLKPTSLLRPEAYRAEWRSLVDEWNHQHSLQGWTLQPPLCETCGEPVYCRSPDPSTKEPSRVCSKQCGNAKRRRTFKRAWKPRKRQESKG